MQNRLGPDRRLRWSLPLLLAFAALTPVSGLQIPDDPELLVRAAEGLAEEGSAESLAAAAETYAAAARIWRARGNAEAAARGYRSAGRTLLRAGALDAALEAAHQGLDLAREAGDSALELTLLDDLAYAEYRAGRRDRALEYLQGRLDRARELGDRGQEADTLGNLGSIFLSWGELQRALDSYRQALDLKRAIGDSESLGTTLNNLALVYGRLGEPERRLELLEEALALHRKNGDRAREAIVLENLGVTEQQLGLLDRAARSFEQALALHGEAPSLGRASVLRNLGSVELRRGDRERAARYHRLALEMAEQIAAPLLLAQAHLGLARVLSLDDASASFEHLAFEHLASAEQIFTSSAHDAGRAAVLSERARLLARDRLEDGLASIEEAVVIREGLRSELLSQRARAGSLGSLRGDYELWVDLLLRRAGQRSPDEHARRAFEVAERALARGALEAVAAGARGSEAPSEVLEIQGRALDRQISELQRRLRGDADQDDADSAGEHEHRLIELIRRREEIHEEMLRSAHDPEAILGLANVSAAQVQGLLDDRTALLEFLVGEEGSVLFVVRRTGLAVHRLPPSAELEDLARELRSSLEHPRQLGLGAYAASARALFQRCLEPAIDDLGGIERLIVAADGPLHAAPLEALLTAPPVSADFAELPYLLRRFVVSYVPSASVLAALGERSRVAPGPRRSALVVAGPSARPDRAEGDPAQRRLVRSVFGADADWSPPPLVAARREAEGIRDALGGERVTLLVDAAATEEAVKANPALAEAGLLHFATHALVSQRDPSLSALVLALDPEGTEDGLLQVSEIERLALSADLVVLSACQTALGREMRGEGMLGLTRAFLSAGARALIASLWSVADESTAELMVRFYRRLRSGDEEAAEALRRAKLELIEQPGLAHPFHWSAFVLQGSTLRPMP